MRAVSVNTATAVSSVRTAPGYLVEIGFTTPSRFSSQGDVDWNGYSWSGGRFLNVNQLSFQGGTLEIGNLDNILTALCLNEGIADRSIKIWKFDRSAIGDDDPVMMFDGVGDELNITLESVSITLAPYATTTLYSPRAFIGPSSGFNYLIPSGTIISAGNKTLKLERK